MAPKRRRMDFDKPPGTHHQTFSFDVMMGPEEDAPMNSFVDVVSADGRRVHRTEIPIGAPASPVKAARRQQLQQSSQQQATPHNSSPLFAVVNEDSYQMALWHDGATPHAYSGEPGAQSSETPTNIDSFEAGSRKVNPADPALAAWAANDRDEFLDLMLWNDGRRGRGLSSRCTGCGTERLAEFRCRECHTQEPMCAICCVAAHAEQPLHWIERWNGHFFHRTSLMALGQRIQLGHPPGEACSAPHPAHSDFTVIHTNGIHSVAVDFCACHLCKDSHHVQLLRRRWYPATSDQPRTCATFVGLDAAHAMSLSSKATLFAYYEHLEWLTDGSGLKPTDRYKALLRILREYRHLLALKRAGRGHAVGGVKSTSTGELAIRCPACPRPGINLPENWQDAPPRDHCLYSQFIAVDACFRLKRGMVSSNAKDPPLNEGWSYMVEGPPYRQYLLTITDQQEISSCTDLAALDHANTKFAKGYTTTGVGMAVCARHEFVLPNAVGDLQRGERYGNMDYILASALRHISRLLRLVVSYDIACQWWKGLRDRLAKLPPLVKLDIILQMVRFVVPKMHIMGHTLACQLLFSLHLTLGCGQTDGEGIERLWAAINALAGSTKLNGPGARSDQLNDHWGFSNWAKLVRVSALLRRRLDAARKECAKQEEAFEAFNEEQAERAPAWLAMVTAFEAPRADGAPEPRNPYEATVTGKTEKQVRAEFEEEDQKDSAAGIPRIHGTSPRSFIMFGLEIEELQSRIRVQAVLKKAKSTASKVNIGNMRRKAEGMLRQWRDLQATYMPAALIRLKALQLGSDVLVENIPLIPPSALTAKERDIGCQEGLQELEVTLRQAQCRVALVALRNQLHIKSRLMKYKKFSSRHQKTNTRTRTLVNRNESKIKLHAEKYQRAWTALSELLGTATFGFDKLKAADIRCMEDPDLLDARGDFPLIDSNEERIRDDEDESEDDGEGEDVFGSEQKSKDKKSNSGESRRTMSWIWYTAGTKGSEEEYDDALRIEWCKAYARSRRWKEEVRMLTEEQRRVPVSLMYEANRWAARAQVVRDHNCGPLLPAQAEIVEGKLAYAAKQHALYVTLAQRAEKVRTAPEGKRRRKPTAEAVVHPDLPNASDSETSDDEDGDEEEPLEDGDAEDLS
ncbi:CxC2 domain-containing protein [Mycena chlorophos]|uniref:CxC2 domain-containing protein n=1 Tax=Mycena chlorophos TaxID=658473 RepID=A0A8H6WAW2_MYCCL|nr:CxC2 domain-containing protein [Mycena chlorophos]